MRRLASFVAILLLLITAAPVLACVTDNSMTHEERACCRAMQGDCGEMAKTGCCRTEFHADVHPQLAASAPQLAFTVLVIGWLPLDFGPTLIVKRPVDRFPNEHSPPGLLIARMTVIRI